MGKTVFNLKNSKTSFCLRISSVFAFNPNRYCWGPFGPTPTSNANISMMAEGKKKIGNRTFLAKCI